VNPIVRELRVRTPARRIRTGWKPALVIIAVHQHAHPQLADVAQADGAVGCRASLSEHGQKDRDQQRDDADDDQKLDKGKAAGALAPQRENGIGDVLSQERTPLNGHEAARRRACAVVSGENDSSDSSPHPRKPKKLFTHLTRLTYPVKRKYEK
jgi:hypothetical protein